MPTSIAAASARPSTPAPADRPAATVRLFLALWPGPQVRQALAAWRDATAWPAGASPTPDDKLHLTLHFIGNVPATRVAEVAAGLQVPMQGFVLQLDQAECWRGGLAVLRPALVPPRLQQLHANLAAALQRLALPVEARDFRPHVTLARRAAPAPAGVAAAPVRWLAAGYALVQSRPDGAYQVLRRWR